MKFSIRAACASACICLPGFVTTACASTVDQEANTATSAPTETAEVCTRSNTHAHSRCGFLDRFDTNIDGAVSRAEFDAARDDSFAEKDADGDGIVMVDEYVAEYEVRLDRQLAERRDAAIRQTHVRFNVLDTDDDSKMTEAEFDASGARMFSRYDTNGDGHVDHNDPRPAHHRQNHH
jgi:hypothetical protein